MLSFNRSSPRLVAFVVVENGDKILHLVVLCMYSVPPNGAVIEDVGLEGIVRFESIGLVGVALRELNHLYPCIVTWAY